MLVVEPPAARFEDGGFGAAHEEHLLERITALENRLTRIMDKLQQTLDLMLKQAKSAYFDHALIDSLITVLNEAGALDMMKLNAIWRERSQQDPTDQARTINRQPSLRTQIIAAYGGTELKEFERFVNAGLELIHNNDFERGIPTLEYAAALDVKNAPLHAFLGQHFFEAGKAILARDYLDRALAADPQNEKARLLLGLSCGDAGEIERARELLNDSIKSHGESFAARYGLGRLLISEQKWTEALEEFKSALRARPSAEAHYALGCVYYQLGRTRQAAQYLFSAVELENNYAAAFYLLGLSLLRLGEKEQARVALSAVCKAEPDEKQIHTAARRALRTNEVPASLKLFGISRVAKKELITGGDKRLAQALLQDALNINRSDGDSN
jgi:tetratricopeptide (TPR) repeat protein